MSARRARRRRARVLAVLPSASSAGSPRDRLTQQALARLREAGPSLGVVLLPAEVAAVVVAAARASGLLEAEERERLDRAVAGHPRLGGARRPQAPRPAWVPGGLGTAEALADLEQAVQQIARRATAVAARTFLWRAVVRRIVPRVLAGELQGRHAGQRLEEAAVAGGLEAGVALDCLDGSVHLRATWWDALPFDGPADEDAR